MSELATVENTQLAAYGEREVVRELVDRLLALHPAASDVGQRGMRAAAQLAILIGASPLPALNEIHIYKDNKDNIKVEPGINFWQRRAEQKGGVRWTVQARPMSEQERRLYGIPDGQLAAICRGVRTDEYHQCREEGMNFQQADDACGVIGIGVVNKTEYAKNGRPLVWTAIKRAKTDFYKQAFPIIPGEGTAGAGMKQGNGGFAPDFDNPQWGGQRDRPESPQGDISWLRDNPVITIDGETGEIIEPDYEDEPELSPELEAEYADGLGADIDEPAEDGSGPEREPDSQITDLRAKLEEKSTCTLQIVLDLAVATGLYDNFHHAKQASKDWPEWEKLPDGTEIKPGMALRCDTGLKLFDWLVDRKQD